MKKLLAWLFVGALALVLFIVVIGGGDEKRCSPSASKGSRVGEFSYPTDKEAVTLTSPFGWREFNGGEHHDGVDLAGPSGTPLYAFAAGRVVNAQDSGVQGFGGWVVLDHTIEGRQIQTVYGHIEPGHVHVSVGDKVRAGDHIADLGNAGFSTGSHLHFEVVEGDRAAGGKKVDPQPWLEKATKGTPKASEEKDHVGGGNDSFGGLSSRQLALAKQIVAVGEAMGIDEKGRIIAVATAKHESQLQNFANDGSGAYQSAGASGTPPEELRKSLEYPHDAVGHDHASVGTFQQQVGIWGTVDELMNPANQAKKFYEALRKVDYQSTTVGVAASTVQRNATGVAVYQRESEIAERLVKHFAGAGDELSSDEIDALSGTQNTNLVSSDPCLPDYSTPNKGMPDAVGSSKRGLAIVEVARSQKGHPYVWGGGDQEGPTNGGFDCSGLVLYAVAQSTGGDVVLPHYTGAQIQDSRLMKVQWEDRQPGDLIYTGGAEPSHVGIYSGDANGTPMWIEAQTFGVPLGEYAVRDIETALVYRLIEEEKK
ncbi:peptidoglycan DD-metalloendopeptidase family protein [Corynebacterium ulcerans]|uniref:peptidoglycan DD-metalloendopeptidase family protein n=1 Tax=Corynebacterium ulcerans TaxID=65058 RepID=UPI003D6FB842